MSKFFSEFTGLKFDVFDEDKETIIVNIMKKVNIDSTLKNVTEIFVDYAVVDGETPEHISNKVYKSPHYHWVILLMNDIYNPYYDWILTGNEVEKLLVKRYGAGNQTDVHHYIDTKGNIVFEGYPEATAITNREFEVEENEKKRNIKVLDPKYLSMATEELSKLMED